MYPYTPNTMHGGAKAASIGSSFHREFAIGSWAWLKYRVVWVSVRGRSMAGETLHIGIDLGTFRSVMVSSDGHDEKVLTVIGTPKDQIAKNFLKRDVLFGEDALKNRLALNLYRPLEHGVIKDTNEDKKFINHFITNIIGLADPEDYDRVVAIIGAPAEASHVDKSAIFDAASGSVNACMIISEPFAVAYALERIEHSLVIDIGAGTTDLCRVYGTIPSPDDQMHVNFAGDYIDGQIIAEVQRKYATLGLPMVCHDSTSSTLLLQCDAGIQFISSIHQELLHRHPVLIQALAYHLTLPSTLLVSDRC